MPKRTDINKILIIGSGPIVIGQACEFDYSGTQGCRALKEEGYEVVLINSNPATIMTDPEFGDKTYIEPLTVEVVSKIIEKERPDALLPTLGGQTALNLTMDLHKEGVLDKFNVQLIGANVEAIEKAEDRHSFKKAMDNIGLEMPRGGFAYNIKDAEELMEDVGFPAIIRPSFTLGGTGANIAYNKEEYKEFVLWGLESSPIGEILIEESIIGWKEFELEVVRDLNDNVIVICSIENLDPMGVHTGDSITVAPAQTLSNKEYQKMRTAAIDVIREIGVDTGGSNIQFGLSPKDGRLIVIEMNPRVSRSSALASKATGFPIAKIAAKLAVGYTLDELENDITKTSACFEPTLDYCVVKIPRFTFEKFPAVPDYLTTQMKSVGEVMSIGRTFPEALQKALRSMERDYSGFDTIAGPDMNKDELIEKLRCPNSKRILYLKTAFLKGLTLESIYSITNIDLWFLENIQSIITMEQKVQEIARESKGDLNALSAEFLFKVKQHGFSDKQIAAIFDKDELDIRAYRKQMDVLPVYKLVDTCAGEFEAYTPYYYSTYERECEYTCSDKESVIILGGGPNRIGQGIEFDYCCVHAVMALKELGYEAIMVNSNPETVSTDYDISDKLFFEPITLEDVLNIIDIINPKGVIVQFGGQTPLKLVTALEAQGVPILGTSPSAIDTAENREKFGALIEKMGINQPPNGTGFTFEEVRGIALEIGYPVLVRPSYVLGGRAMEIVYDETALKSFIKTAAEVSPGHPVLVDKFLEGAIELDVDAVCDGTDVVIGSVMQHIEEAGVHSGDSACSIPTVNVSEAMLTKIRSWTRELAFALEVVGLMNIQYAIQGDKAYILEVNPRASRTIPFVSKAIGKPLAKIAAQVMVGKTLKELDFTKEVKIPYYCVKEVVLPFVKFPGSDILLGPEMRSTGEVMGIDESFSMAFAKAQMGAFVTLPSDGAVFISVNDTDKPKILPIAKMFLDQGFTLLATWGTWNYFKDHGLDVKRIYKVNEGRPNVVDAMKNGEIDIIINSPLGKLSQFDERSIRTCAVAHNLPCITTIPAARAAIKGIEQVRNAKMTIKSIQEYHLRGKN